MFKLIGVALSYNAGKLIFDEAKSGLIFLLEVPESLAISFGLSVSDCPKRLDPRSGAENANKEGANYG